MSADDSNKILKWVSDTFADVAVLNYEMINPSDKFGQMMIENLEQRGCNLLGYKECPTIESQIERMKQNFGENSQAECIPMNEVYKHKLNNDGEKTRIEKLEIFDEFEEWELLQSHYCLCLSKRGNAYQQILELKI